jgi:cytochrome c
MHRRSLLAIALLASLLTGVAQAQDRATPEDAKAMAMKAADYLKEAGAEKAFAAFNASGAPWHDRDLYVYVADPNCKILAHGAMPTLVGRTLDTLKDVDGKPIVQQAVAVKQAGWVDYKWQNPTSKAIEAKTTYVVHVGDYVVAVGAYK